MEDQKRGRARSAESGASGRGKAKFREKEEDGSIRLWIMRNKERRKSRREGPGEGTAG